ncbi:MAG: transporter [Saprospiraceae bacterium]|nr:transporter [Saprospiraceae bacterium]
MKTRLYLILLVAAMPASALMGQGCVAIRSMGCSGNTTGGNTTGLTMKGDFSVATNYRYFKSFRHFRGKHEEANRVAEGTEVINHFHGIDLSVSYGITNRLSATLTLPVNINNRSSMYEHYGNSESANPDRQRFETNSAGLSDIRTSLSYWLRDPAMHPAWNVAVGAGVKFPSGNYKVEDEFHKLDEEGNDYTVTRPVDQSIQLGDGGTGVSLEVQGFGVVYNNWSVFGSAFYMANPKNTNGVLRNPTSDPSMHANFFSVADQYAARLGIGFATRSPLSISLASRLEGIPATDLIGKSEGFRRPGYALSVEPGLSWVQGRFLFNLNVPVAIERNRIRSLDDKQRDRHGDAAFADYVVNFSAVWFIPNHRSTSRSEPSELD